MRNSEYQHRQRLLRDEKTLETTYTVDNSLTNIVIPYDDFYQGDGEYRIEANLQGVTTNVEVEVAGEDGVYDPPNELARYLTIIGIAIALSLLYVVKSPYGRR